MGTNDAKVVGEALAKVLPRTDRPWFRVSYLLRLNMLLLMPLMSSAIAGYDGSLMNGLQALPSWKRDFGNPQGHSLGAVNAAQSAGCVVVLPLVGMLADGLGRRWTLLIGAVVIILASVVQSVAVNLGMFIFSRALVGAGAITIIQPSPLLISELAYPTHRGILTALYWTFYYLGAILAAWSTYGLQKWNPDSHWAWRGPSILQGGLPVLQLLFWWYLPESPRWLIANCRYDEARSVLAKYHAGGDLQHALVDFEMIEITRAIELDAQSKDTKWSALFASVNRKRIFITVFIGFMSQWAGNSVVSYYLTLVLDSVGITNPDTQTLINGLLQLFNFGAAVMAAFLVNRLGRRTLFNWSGVGMAISFAIWTACSARFAIAGGESLGIAVIAFIFIYFFHYDIAYTPLVIAYATEILPYSIRSKGVSLSLAVIYSSLVLLSFLTPIALDAIQWRYYILFCCLLGVSVVVNWVLLPETRGRTLEEVADLFEDKKIAQDIQETKPEPANVDHVELVCDVKLQKGLGFP
ncbi:similar to hexose transporter [Plenodomus lingam JN3]|uniref:Similar to hexose transporter n=1 Tax=Leptosphaeria maculans (strain JN3 / isolate v23.1.3 / race Av1-4-5-6-7-8) TaxID=985895 RepID=E4ZQE6_LEPMJ|nr:similar to hexose transporter [Plenodomus lingam JN3]CBX93621.1 similar to hexose transporter [Plenodomus lingam JN3]